MVGFSDIAKVISLGATVLGVATKAKGAAQQADAQAASLSSQAGIARKNQQVARSIARKIRRRGDIAVGDALARGDEAEANLRRNTRQLIGRQRAVLASNGVVVDQDVALAITTDTARIGQRDLRTLRGNVGREVRGVREDAELRAFETEQRGEIFGAEAQLHAQSSSSVEAAGRINVFSTVLGGIGSVADKWYGFNKKLP